MNINKIIEAKAELTHGDHDNCPVVLSTRIRLARNLNEFSFPGWAKESQRREILSKCFDAVSSVPELSDSSVITIDELNDLEKQVLMERRLISRELTQTRKGAGLVVSKDQSCAIMVNEEDHLRIQFVSGGFNFKRIWKSVDDIDTHIENHLDYAFSPEIGYLTACPTNVGTGLRASAMMHLPALVISKQMEKVIRAVNQLGIAVRGLFGEGSDASGSIFQISNQQTLGESEEDIIKRLTNVLQSVIDQENNCREKLLETEPVKISDKIGRAYGILCNSYSLSSAETMKLLSLIRLAIDLHMLSEDYRSRVDRMIIEAQPGHIQYAAGEQIDPGRRDEYRAKYIREQFSQIPPLSFDKLVETT